MKKVKQRDIILNAMLQGEAIDAPTARLKYRVKALPAVIRQLRKEGYYFDISYVRHNARRIVARYELRPGT